MPTIYRGHSGACLGSASTKDELVEMAEQARAGFFGDIDDWSAAELRWDREGVVEEDLTHTASDKWPFDAKIAERGFPLSAASWQSDRNFDISRGDDIITRLRGVADSAARARLAFEVRELLTQSGLMKQSPPCQNLSRPL